MFFVTLRGTNLDAITEVKVVCSDYDNNYVVSEAVLDEESSTATEAVWLFFPDCAATSLRYDSIFVNGVQMFKASDSTYRV